MTRQGLITTPVGTTLEEAREILARHRIEKLPVVDAEGRLHGLITVKDIEKRIRHPHACKDSLGRLRVAAAIGSGDEAIERAPNWFGPASTRSFIDSAHAHSKGVLDTARQLRERHRDVDSSSQRRHVRGAKAIAALEWMP